MAKFHILPLYVADLVGDCAHLSDTEFGRYMRIIILMWRSPDCRIPADPQWITKRINCDALAYAHDVQPIMQEFCTLQDGFWIQKRLLKEYQKVKATQEKRALAARQRWGVENKGKTPKQKQSKSNAHGMLSISISNSIDSSNDESIQTPTPFELTPDAKGLWLGNEYLGTWEEIPAAAWRDFVEHRAKMGKGKKLTVRAAQLILKELQALMAQGNDPARVLNQSIMRGWAGVFPLKDDAQQWTKPRKLEYATEMMSAAASAAARKMAEVE